MPEPGHDESRPIDIGTLDPPADSPEELPLGFADESADQPRKNGRGRRIALSALLFVTLAGSGTLAYAGWQIATQKDATLSTPPTIGALRLDASEDGRTTAEYLQTALAAEVDGLKKGTGAVYLDAGGKNVLFSGGTGLLWAPETELNSAFDLIADNEGAVTGIHDVDAGELGGDMKCGTTKTDDGDLPVCGWADHGSIALALFPNRSEQEAAGLLREIRSSTQTR